MEREKEHFGQEKPPLLSSFVFSAKEDKLKIKGMVRKWQDKEMGHQDDNLRPIIILYAGEKHDHEPVAFITEENEVLKIVVVGRTPELAEKHRETIVDIVKKDLRLS